MAGAYGSNMGYNVNEFGTVIGRYGDAPPAGYAQSASGSGPSQRIANGGGDVQPAPFVANPQLTNSQNIPSNAYNGSLATPPRGSINGGANGATPGGAVANTMGSGLDAILKQINASYDAQTGLATQQAGKDWRRGMGARGLGVGDMASQAMNQQILGDAMAPLAAGRSSAIGNAMLADQNSQVQNQQFQQSLDLRRQDMLQSNALSQQQFGLQQSAQNFDMQQARERARWEAEDRQRQLANSNLQNQVTQRNLQNQLNGGVGPGSAGPQPWRDPLTGGTSVFTGSSGYNPFAPAGGTAGNAATQAMGGAPLGAGSGAGDTLNAGSTAGLNPDGSWRHPGQHSPNTGGERVGAFSPNTTVNTTGPSSGGATTQPGGIPGLNTQAGQRGTNPSSIVR